MAISYIKATEDINEMLTAVMKKHEPDLYHADVQVDVLMANGGADQDGVVKPAIVIRKSPKDAVIAVVGIKQRALGLGDALLLIDQNNWAFKSERERHGVLHHELHHLELMYDKEGDLKVDDQGRPKLTTRPHDRDVGGFDAVAKAHGEAAPEVQLIQRVVDEAGQYYLLGFGTPKDVDPNRPPAAPLRVARGS